MGNVVSDSLDSIPVVGHVKGVFHNIAGDHEGAKKAYMASSRSMVLLASAVVAGPAGATVAGVLTDSLVSAVTKEAVGFIRNVERISEANGLGEALVGVGKMGLDMGLDTSGGMAAGGTTRSVGKQATKQVLKSTSKTVAKQVVKKVAVNQMVKSVTDAALDHSRKRSELFSDTESELESYQHIFKIRIIPKYIQTDSAIRRRPNGGNTSSQAGSGKRERSTSPSQSDTTQSQSSSQSSHKTMSEYMLSSSDEEDSSNESYDDKLGGNLVKHVKNGYIYYFLCAGGLYKVGMTKRDIMYRLNEHKRKEKREHRPKQDKIIKVFACDDARQAETRILQIAAKKSSKIPGIEYFCECIESVIKQVVAEVNSIQIAELQISYYKLNAGNKIVELHSQDAN